MFISFLRAVGILHMGVCTERMSEIVWCYLLDLQYQNNGSRSVFIDSKSALDEVLRRKEKNNFAKFNNENKETTKTICV
jgi:hypothetical protein